MNGQNIMTRETYDNLNAKVRAEWNSVLEGKQVLSMDVLDEETGEITTIDLLEKFHVLLAPLASTYRADNYVSNLLEIQANGGVRPSKPKPSKEGFVLAMYESAKSLRERFSDLNEADLGRLMYLSSFVAWADSKQGRIQFDNGAPIKRKHFAELVGMSTRRAIEYLDRLINAGILTQQDEQFYMNETVFYYGAASKLKNPTFDFIRVYKSAVREIYEQAGSKAAPQLALIYAVLPYVNKNTNVICTNPHEANVEAIEFLTMKDLAILLGYADSRTLKTAMNKIKLKDEVVFCFTENPNNRRQTFVTINPKVIFGGNNEKLALIETYFNQRQELLEIA